MNESAAGATGASPQIVRIPPLGIRIQHFDNASESEEATFIAFYLLAANERELIRMLPETNPLRAGGAEAAAK